MATTTKSTPSWRDVLLIHPAAELFPRMTPDELRELGEDIRKNGLTSPIVLWQADAKAPVYLLDGRNRLDAIELAMGMRAIKKAWNDLANDKFVFATTSDPYAFVISANIRRHHLTAEQKRDLIAKLLKAAPEKSDRQMRRDGEGESHHRRHRARQNGGKGRGVQVGHQDRRQGRQAAGDEGAKAAAPACEEEAGDHPRAAGSGS
jgi:hypothetical protein